MNKHNVVTLCTNVLIVLCAALIVALTGDPYGMIALACLQRPIAQDLEIDPEDIVTYSSLEQQGLAAQPYDPRYGDEDGQNEDTIQNRSEYSNSRTGFTSQV